MKRKNGFTLIELVAVLVILAILALIVTPLVMNIIRKARISADKRSIDAYGRSVELAIASYLLDNGKFPTSIEELTIEYIGDEVVCSTSKLNSDSSVYLTGCRVAGRSIDYTYGKEETITYNVYNIGDLVEYNHNTYYVIKNSDETENYVTLLKDVPLMEADVNTYLTSTGIGGVAVNQNGYGGMSYGSSSNYETSNIKKVVDAWAQDTTNSSDLVVDSTGYSVRLISHDELINNLGYINSLATTETAPSSNGSTPEFVYDNQYYYWTMSQYGDNTSNVWYIGKYGNGYLNYYNVNSNLGVNYGDGAVVRPVINLLKSAIN